MSGAEDEVHTALSDALARLGGNGRFTVVEFGANGATIVRIYRDANGTPRPEEPRPDVRASAMRSADAFYRELDPDFIVRTSAELPAELLDLLPGRRDVPVYECQTSLKELVKVAIKVSPLVLGYQLAVLRQLPDGRLELAGHPLFPVGASTGHEVKIRVRYEATDGDGTTFAVVTRELRPDIPPRLQEFQPVQIQSAVVEPGSREVTARLDRPGRVLFHGLPMLDKSPASPDGLRKAWDDRRSRIPQRLAKAERVHLVCLIEVSGGDERLNLRIERLAKLIAEAESGVRELLVSVIAYGPHSVSWAVDEEPYRRLAWAQPSQVAEQALRGLAGRVADEREYQEAAQLECVLQGVATHLSDDNGRPVLVTAGGRPPHPHEMDTDTGIIPCPDRVSWRRQLDQIDALGTAFGALRDQHCRGAIWQALGREATGTVDDAVDMTDFATRLGLRGAGQTVPFPFID
jgi:hypothetical protein